MPRRPLKALQHDLILYGSFAVSGAGSMPGVPNPLQDPQFHRLPKPVENSRIVSAPVRTLYQQHVRAKNNSARK
jgi:hypothetical protein